MSWESAERVQKNERGEFRALIGGEWLPVAKAQKSESGAYRIMRATESPKAQAAPFVPSGEKSLTVASPAELIAGFPITRFALGAASPVIGAAQLGANAVGLGKQANTYVQNLEDIKRRGMKAYGDETDVAGFAGAALTPVGLAAGKARPAATSVLSRAGQGAAIGAGFGATAPVTNGGEGFWDTKAAQTGTGAAIGGAIPLGMDAAFGIGRAGKNLVDAWLPGGIDRAVGRTANAAAGPDKAAIIAELRKPNEIVPGSMPTAGEAASGVGRAEFSGLQEAVKGRAPTAYDARAQSQNAARVDSLRTVGKTPQALESAVNQRSANAAQNYGAAYAQQIRANPELAQLMANPYVKDEIATAVKLAEANGITPKSDLTQFLHYVKIGLDKQLSKTGNDSLSSTQQKAVQDAKTSLVEWMKKANPEYNAARSTFAAESKPINQMKVGQYLEGKLTPALNDLGASGSQRSAAYAQALRDAPGTLKRATGQPRYDELGEVLTPPQLGAATGVGEDLARTATHERLARAGMEKARELVGQVTPKVPAAGMFSPHYSVARAIINRIEGRVAGKSVDRLAEAMQNPQEMARLMEGMAPAQRTALAQALRSMGSELRVPGYGAATLPAVRMDATRTGQQP